MSTPTQYKKTLAVALVVPVVAALGLSAAAPSSGAVSQQAYNGGFEAGRAGWTVTTPGTKMKVVKKGIGGSRAAKLTTRRGGPVALASTRPARSAAANQRYVVSAYVRTNNPGAVGRLVVREAASGKAGLETARSFRASRAWQKVALTAVTKRASSVLQVRVAMVRLAKKKNIVVDGFSIVRATATAGGHTTPKPPTTTPPTTPPANPPSSSPGKMSNGCAISGRGIPVASCGAMIGSAFGSNTDPTTWEKEMGRNLGVHRTYYGASQVDKAVSVSKADLAQNRIPWISFKLPYSWSEMAAGKGDAWTRDLSVKLSKLNGPVWVAFHHEPEGDGDIKQWTAMQARLAPIVRASAPNVAFTIVLTGWHEFFGAAEYHLDNLMPKNTKVDMIGIDVYNFYGVVKDGKTTTKMTDFAKSYFQPLNAWTKAHGMAWGVAETGFTDSAATKEPQWVANTYNLLKANNGVAFTYFNTTLNSIANWALSTTVKKTGYASALRSTPTL
jgi:hypothetical protein